MRAQIISAVAVIGLWMPLTAAAQDFGVLNSAETINRGNVKLMGSPMVVFGEDGADNTHGFALAAGYGFTDRFDVEGKLAFFDDVTFLGADAEVWLARTRPVYVSAIVGFHVGRQEGFNTRAFDATLLASGFLTPRLELFGGLDLARHAIEDRDDGFTTVHVVPGIEYAISPRLDFVAELGIGLNDEASNYLTGGLAFYFGPRP